jgi:hypothetical protein
VRTRRLVLAAAAVACVAASGGCGNGQPSSSGPLGPGSNGGYYSICVRAPGDSDSFGGPYLQNQGSSTITITGISLAGRGVKLIGAVLIPGVRNSGIGDDYGYPPSPDSGLPANLWARQWATRKSPDGYQLKPGAVAALVEGVAATTKSGGTGYPVISYAYGGLRYVLREAWGARVIPVANC